MKWNHTLKMFRRPRSILAFKADFAKKLNSTTNREFDRNIKNSIIEMHQTVLDLGLLLPEPAFLNTLPLTCEVGYGVNYGKS